MNEVLAETQPKAAMSKEEWEWAFRFGYRYVEQKDKEGKLVPVQVPLTEEDVLHPQEDDFIVQNDYHSDDCDTLKDAIKSIFGAHITAGQHGVFLRFDGRVDFQCAGVEGLGPDLALFDNLNRPWERGTGTLNVKDYQARCRFVIEVASPSTRDNDVEVKPDLYHQVGVPFYYLVDYVPELFNQGQRVIRLAGYRQTPAKYEEIPLDEHGRLWVEPAKFFIGVEGDHIVCFDAQGVRIPTSAENRQRAEANAKLAQTKENERNAAEQKSAEMLAAFAALAKLPAEQQSAELQALLARFQQPNPPKPT